MSEDEIEDLLSPHLDNAESDIEEAFRIAGEQTEEDMEKVEEYIKDRLRGLL